MEKKTIYYVKDKTNGQKLIPDFATEQECRKFIEEEVMDYDYVEIMKEQQEDFI